jgi:hypothetical protein
MPEHDRQPAWVRYLWSMPVPRIQPVKAPAHTRWGVVMLALVLAAIGLAVVVWCLAWALGGQL